MSASGNSVLGLESEVLLGEIAERNYDYSREHL
jgi:hypothetical protein